MTVTRLLTEATSAELSRWLVFYQIEAAERAREQAKAGG